LERSRENAQLFSTQLHLVKKRERKRLAAELHDYLAQLLVVGHIKVGEAAPLVFRSVRELSSLA
jgi:signal transduction histidine kinase